MIGNSWFMVSIDLNDDGKNICIHRKLNEKNRMKNTEWEAGTSVALVDFML